MNRLLPLIAGLALNVITISNDVNAQSTSPWVISSGGGFYSGSNHSLSVTVGELATTTLSANNKFLTQGFQQPDYYLLYIKPEDELASAIKVYPNPFRNDLFISIDVPETSGIRIEVYDIQGRLVKSPLEFTQSFGQQVYKLDVSNLSSGIFFVRVVEEDRSKLSEFKIVRM